MALDDGKLVGGNEPSREFADGVLMSVGIVHVPRAVSVVSGTRAVSRARPLQNI